MTVNLSHHFSEVSKNRTPLGFDQGVGYGSLEHQANLADGWPNPFLFPCRKLELDLLHLPGRSCHGDFAGSLLPKINHQSDLDHLKIPFQSKHEGGIDLASSLQYGPAAGHPHLLETVRLFVQDYLHSRPTHRGEIDVILTCGSTDGMSKCLELLTNTWSESRNRVEAREGIIVESFVYPVVLAQARPRGLNIIPVAIDSQGVLSKGPGSLSHVLKHWDYARGRRPHIMYTVSIGHNPTGAVVTPERRRELYELCCHYDIVIIEDEPYWFSCFSGQTLSVDLSEQEYPNKVVGLSVPCYIDIDREGRVIRLDSFSKILAPGCRLGWVTALPAVIERLQRITEAFALHPSGFAQGIVAAMLQNHSGPERSGLITNSSLIREEQLNWQIDGWIYWLHNLRTIYEGRMHVTCRLLENNKSAVETEDILDEQCVRVSARTMYEFRWPDAGIFVWLHMKFHTHPLWQALRRRCASRSGCILANAMHKFLEQEPRLVMIAPGVNFTANKELSDAVGWQYCRLCYATPDTELLEQSVRRFLDGLRQFWAIRDLSVIDNLCDDFELRSREHTTLE